MSARRPDAPREPAPPILPRRAPAPRTADPRRLVRVPRSFIKMTLGAPTGVDVEALKAENDQLRKKCDDLSLDLATATKKLEAFAPEGEQ